MKKLFQGEEIVHGAKILGDMMKKSASTVVLTGAGMDTESNIPDFRGKKWLDNMNPHAGGRKQS